MGGPGLSRRGKACKSTHNGETLGHVQGCQQVQDCWRAGEEGETGPRGGRGPIWAICPMLGFHLVSTPESLKEFVISTSR